MRGKRDRQENALIRTEAHLAVYKEELTSKKDNVKLVKFLKKKIERATATIENTKNNMK